MISNETSNHIEHFEYFLINSDP